MQTSADMRIAIKVNLFIGLVLIAMGSIAFAADSSSQNTSDSNLQRDLRVASTLQAQYLVDRGVCDVGGFNLQKFIEEAKQIEFQISDVDLNTQGRFGFRNIAGLKRVIVSAPELCRSTASEIQILLMHEVLGALGYSDQVYQISSAISALASVRATASPQAFNAALPKFKFNSDKSSALPDFNFRNDLNDIQLRNLTITKGRASGGSSEGGHGGDPTGAKIKSVLIQFLLKKNASQKLIHFVVDQIDIEEFEGENSYTCAYDRETFERLVIIEKTANLFIIRVPMACREQSSLRELIAQIVIHLPELMMKRN